MNSIKHFTFILHTILYFSIFANPMLANGKGANVTKTEIKGSESIDLLKKAVSRYKSAGEIEMKVKKTLNQELLSKQSEYEGKLYLSKGKIRWEIEMPEKSLLVFDGRVLWDVQLPAVGDKTPIQVAKMMVDEKNSKPDLFLALLSGDKSIDKTFKARFSENQGTTESFELKSKEHMSIRDVKVFVIKTTRTISKLIFFDDVGNKTTMEFTDIKFFQAPKPAHFKYSPPKGAQITNLN